MTTPNMQKMQQLVEQELLSSYDSLYRLAFTYVKNESDAMDIVQGIVGSQQLLFYQLLHFWRIHVAFSFQVLNKLDEKETEKVSKIL